jgi:hypothetical protein
MRNLLYALALVPFIFASKCGEEVVQFKLNETFELMPGQTMACEGSDLQLTFVEVKDDSRCPKGVDCIRAGEAHVIVKVTGASTEEVTLEIGAGQQTNPSQFTNSYQIQATALEPYPEDGKKTEPADYRLSLRVSEKAGS